MKKQTSILLKNNLKIIVLLIFVMSLSCSETEYSKLVKKEMAQDIVKDSIIFGMKFGQTRQLFYDQCWKLNNKKIITHGPSNNFVQYQLPIKEGDSTKNAITMLFYGIFNEEKIMTGMDMKFYYVAWSLWNESFQSDKLVPIVKDSLLSWFPGNDFITFPVKNKEGLIHVKVDGNRRIMIEPLKNTKDVDVRIDDLKRILDKKL